MRIDPKKFFTAFFIFIGTLIGLGYYHFQQEQKEINQTINTSLERSAEAASVLIGDDFHERINTTSPTQLEDAATIKALTTLARSQKVDAIYSYRSDAAGNLYFTACSAGDSLLSQTGLIHFGEVFPKSEDAIRALRSNQPVWNGDEEQKRIRTLYVPNTTSAGERYVIAVDIRMEAVDKLSHAAGFKAVANALIIFLGVLPFLLIYRNAVHGKTEELTEQVEATTEELHEVNEILVHKVEEKTKELISQSFEDPLTGLPNRHRFQYDLERRHHNALMIVNVQNYRDLSAFFGPEIGNDLLRQMGHWLETLDMIPYRLSGDEFAILIEESRSRKELEESATRLLNRLKDHPFSIGIETISLDVAIGIDPGPESVSLPRADTALRHAKKTGTGMMIFDASLQLDEHYKENLAHIKMIHDALEAGRIICFYQPIVSCERGLIEKYATLARMIDEQGQLIGPDDFITMAQKTRLYPQITRTVVSQACETFSSRNESFTITLSIKDMTNPSTIRFIEETLVQTDTARRVIFDIRESEASANFAAASNFIRRMKTLGARIAIDNFGKEPSTIDNLLRLHADFIKIDSRMVEEASINPKEATTVEALSEFAKKLGVETIAVHVTDEASYRWVQKIGISYAQGNYTGKPAALALQ